MSVSSTKSVFKSIFDDHRKAIEGSFTDEQITILERIAAELSEVLKRGNKILLCGNGGSAADSQHIAAEFIGRFKRERKSLPSIALTTDTSILTAIANDYSYERVFERQVEGLGVKGDALIGISTSGNSKNVIQAAKKAKTMGLLAIGLTGESGGALKSCVDINFSASTAKTPHIQEIHITTLHAISEVIENTLFPT
jgi:D-sedoheptulose 7-phosphate isomerase